MPEVTDPVAVDPPPDPPEFVFDTSVLQTSTERIRQYLQNYSARPEARTYNPRNVWLEMEPLDSEVPAPVPAPEPEPGPEADPAVGRVWIMPTPNRRGPGRAVDINRHPRWRDRLADIRANGPGSALAGEPRSVEGYRCPRAFTGSSYHMHWWFLGWADNGLPMFAAQRRPERVASNESEMRLMIRRLISDCEYRSECTVCWGTYPMSSTWPPAVGCCATVHMDGYGQTTMCQGCSQGMETCQHPTCTVVGRRNDMAQVVTTFDGTTVRVCGEHRSRSTVDCPHCHLLFSTPSLREPHNCVGSPQEWAACTVCLATSRRYEMYEFADGERPVCTSRCARSVRRCTMCQFYGLGMVEYGEGYACVQCQSDHEIDQCEHCARWFADEDDHDCTSGGSCSCFSCRSGQANPVRSYSYKPRPRFKGTDKHGLFLGMELEIFMDRSHSVTDVARSTQDLLGKVAYLKSDGSIGYGFELVTHPMSYDYAMNQFPWEVLSHLSDTGSFATEGSGIHVHASRAGFAGAAHEYRWMIFLHRNSRHCQVMARRVSEQWASFGGDQRKIAKDIATKKVSDTRRYRAINQTNAHTIEVRIFQSSTDEQTVKATIGLVHASIEYTRVIRSADVIKDEAWTWTRFAAWVSKRPEYAPLWAEMQRLGCTADDLSVAHVPVPTDDCECEGSGDCYGDCSCDECSPCRERATCVCDGDGSCGGQCGCSSCYQTCESEY